MPIDASTGVDDRAPRRPRWLPTIAAMITVALCVTAGNWQHRRMLEKEALRTAIAAAAAAPAAPMPASVSDWRDWRFRRVTAIGTFDAGHQILIDNVVRAGRAGFSVVTPFVLDDGRRILVDRGWTAGTGSRAVLPSPAVPQSTLTLAGRIDIPSPHYLELGAAAAPSGTLWQHLDPERFSQSTGMAVLPVVLRLLDTRGDGLVPDDALPDTGVERHASYMVQWYAFAALAAGFWAWFAVRPWLATRRQ